MLEVGFEPTSAYTADFKSAPLDQAPASKLKVYSKNIVLEVGFEPTSAYTADFKSAPLDQAPAFKLEEVVL